MRVITKALLYAAWLAATAAASVVHDSSFVPDRVLRVNTAILPMACESRLSAVVNGTFPGPTLHIPAGTATWIRVYNDMKEDNLTMHWHGITQRMAPFSDGSSMATQWPIAPGHFFDYEIFPEATDAGTFFYHSHVGMQALSCFGALIVDDCGAPPYHYDDERVWQFSDYFNETDSAMTSEMDAVPYSWGGVTNAVLLNGKGVGLDHKSTPEPGDCCLPVIDIEAGKTYRFRYIGATGLSFTTIGIEGHDNLTIIAVDGGQYTKPVSVDHIQLGSGQRFDALFKAKTADELKADGKTQYYIQWETRDGPSRYRGFGILRYHSSELAPAAPETSVVELPEKIYDWLEYTLAPLYPEQSKAPTAEEVTRRLIIDSVLEIDPETKRTMWRLNNLSWTEESQKFPVLVDIYEHGDAAVPDYEVALRNYGWDPRTQTWPAKIGEVLEIVWQNTGALVNNSGALEIHPFHAHGEHYFDLGSGNGTYDPVANEAKIKSTGYQPVKRDTTMLYRYENRTIPGADAGWRAWRFRVSDPGVWMIHCHTLSHMMMGMQSVWVYGNAEQIVKIPLEESQGYFTYGSDVYGNATHDPIVYPFFQDNGSTCPAATKTEAQPVKTPCPERRAVSGLL